jgi:hypothetical protein
MVGQAGAYQGGHGVCVVGYDDDRVYGPGLKGAFKLANSWGDDWGNAGFFWIGYEYFRTEGNNSDSLTSSNQLYALYDRPGYEPRATATVTIEHPRREQLRLAVAVEHEALERYRYYYLGNAYPDYQTWNLKSPYLYGGPGTDAPMTTVVLDVSELLAAVPADGTATWSLLVGDAHNDEVSGTVTGFSLESGGVSESVTVSVPISQEMDDGTDLRTRVPIQVSLPPATPSVLLVDGDHEWSYPGFANFRCYSPGYETEILQTLTTIRNSNPNLAFRYVSREWGDLDSNVLGEYDTVFWSTGGAYTYLNPDHAPLSAEETAMLRTYLDQGGSLLLTGEASSATLSPQDPLVQSGIGATDVGWADTVQPPETVFLSGVADDPVTDGLQLTLSRGVSTDARAQSRVNRVVPGTDTTTILTRHDTGACAGTRRATDGRRVIHYPFTLHYVAGDRTPLLQRSLEWFGFSPQPVSITLAPTSVTENTDVDPVLTLSMPAPCSRAVTVDLAFSGTAVRGQDVLVPESVTIPAGQVQVEVPVTVVDDSAVEGTEVFGISIQRVENGTIGEPATASLTITDDETARVRFATAASSVDETDAPAETGVPLVLDLAGTPGALHLELEVTVTVSEQGRRQDLVVGFPVNSLDQTVADVLVTVDGDDVAGIDRQRLLQIETVIGPADAAEPGQHLLTVVEDDAAPMLDLAPGMPGNGRVEVYTEGDAPLPLARTTEGTIGDTDSQTLYRLEVELLDPPDTAYERVLATAPLAPGLELEVAEDGRALAVSGPGSPADYAAALAALAYEHTGQAPTPGVRTLVCQVSDGTNLSKQAPLQIEVVPVNDPPVIDLDLGAPGTGVERVFVVGQDPITLLRESAFGFSDPDSPLLESLVIQLDPPPPDGESEALATTESVPGLTVVVSADSHRITAHGPATADAFERFAVRVTYGNTALSPTTGTRTVVFTLSDAEGAASQAEARVEVSPGQVIPLASGWNLLALPLSPTVRAAGAGWLDHEKWTQNDTGYQLTLARPQAFSGFWQYRTGASLIEGVTGTEPAGPAALAHGWNLVGPATESTAAVQWPGHSITAVWEWVPERQCFRFVPSDEKLVPWKGYWIHTAP